MEKMVDSAVIEGKLEVKNLCFTESTVRRKPTDDAQFEIKYTFGVVFNVIDEKSQQVVLQVTAADDDTRLSVSVTLQADVELVNAGLLEEKVRKQILDVNSVAILLPYLRSQVVLITAQPGLVPLQLPIVDANILVENAVRN